MAHSSYYSDYESTRDDLLWGANLKDMWGWF